MSNDDKVFEDIPQQANALKTSLDSLNRSLGDLNKTSMAMGGLVRLSESFNKFAEALKSFKLIPQISKEIKGLDFQDLGTNISKLSVAFGSLRGFDTKASALINSLSNVREGVKSVNATDFRGFDQNMEKLVKGLEKLNSINSKVGATIDALGQVSKTIDDLAQLEIQDSLGETAFMRFGNSINLLVKAIEPLASIRSTLGVVLRELRRFVATAQSLSTVDMSSFENTIQNIRTAIVPLRDIELGEFGKAAKALRTLVKAVVELSTMNQRDITKFDNTIAQTLSTLAHSLKDFRDLDLTGFSRLVKSLTKIPEIIAQFNAMETSDVDKFVERVQLLANALEPLERRLSSTVIGLKKLPNALNKGARAADGMGRSTKKLGSNLFNLRTLLGGAGIVYAIRRFTNLLARSFKISNDYTETLNLFTVALDRAADASYEVVKGWQTVLGLDPAAAMAKWGEFNLLLEGFGDSSEKWLEAIPQMSQNLTQLAYDLSSLYNVDPEVAMTKLQSGISGMSRPLREWGLDVSAIALQEFALSRGIQKSVTMMTQAEKAQLRYLLLMHKTSEAVMNIQGDLAKTLETPGNAIRILRQRIVQLKRAIGDFITPIVTSFIPYVMAFVKGLTIMFNKLSEVMYRITGFVPHTMDDFRLAHYDLAEALSKVDTTIGDYEEHLEYYYELTQEAKKATDDYAASIYGLVGGIDKFNVLSKSENEGIGGSIFVTDEELLPYDFFKGLTDAATEAEKKLEPFFTKLTNMGVKFIEVFEDLNMSVEKFANIIGILITYKMAGWFVGLAETISRATVALAAYNAGAKAAAVSSQLLSTVAIFGLVLIADKLYKIIKNLITNWNDLTTAQKISQIAFASLIILVGALWVKFVLLQSVIGKVIVQFGVQLVAAMARFIKVGIAKIIFNLYLQFRLLQMGIWDTVLGIAVLTVSIATLAAGIYVFTKLADKMKAWEKVVVIFFALAAAFTAAAVAKSAFTAGGIGAMITAAAVAGGIALAIGSVIAASTKFAEGGFPTKGSLFVAGEKGPEWLGKSGKSSTVVNDSQMSDIMYQAVRDGVIDAIIATDKDGEQKQIVFKFDGLNKNDLARVLFRPMVDEVTRQGYKLVKN